LAKIELLKICAKGEMRKRANKVKISMIAAIAEDRGIGKDNQLLFKIREDLKRFKKITLGQPVVMGRKTFESIGKPLAGRLNIVVTRNKDYKAKGVLVVHSLKGAVEQAEKKTKQEIFIIGGGEIYKQGIKLADKLYLTIVEGKYKADTFFPDYSDFKIIKEERKESGGYKYRFVEFKKII
jgi:dihydrofolate reductase